MVLDGIEGFSINLEKPELRVNDLYRAVFAPIMSPVDFAVEASSEVLNDKKAASYFKDLKTIIENATKEINESLGNR
ncbi:MAG: hypothetical protein LKI67_02720 [Olsenella sp.]|jgi:hypothetical protein|nr:hypothetical protein [Olsenella sp.]MCI1645873.1 hypothetical protein [Olsenella sp.]MCI1810749.1 hypothetical protein [Olsenella sp.]